ncbi:unnamed protein product [Prorocentrum cordatum]|uniref:Uncharacterized protein n=1 Tax=Prorocentrum cordatum TaxID=2364126 RepID=A0ABN9XNR4_9DINO|nr:unnamed protein product [Polarella glacialis]
MGRRHLRPLPARSRPVDCPAVVAQAPGLLLLACAGRRAPGRYARAAWGPAGHQEGGPAASHAAALISSRRLGPGPISEYEGRKDKMGEQDETLIIGILDRAIVKDVAVFLYGSAHDGERVFRHLTLPFFEKAIKEVFEPLELQDLRIAPHCFRHTGPSTDAYMKALSFQLIQVRGKWKCPASAR